MRLLVTLFVLCAATTGCLKQFTTHEMTMLGVDDVPLPPDTREFKFKPGDTPGSYDVSVKYLNKSIAEIEDFYRTFFALNGWKDSWVLEEEEPGLLLYEKGNASYTVTTIELPSSTRLLLSYNEYEYSHEEFSALVKESADEEASNIVDKVLKAYGALESYKDSGHFKSIEEGAPFDTLTFSTKYVNSGDFLFEFSSGLSNGFNVSSALSRVSDTIQGMSSFDAAPEEYEDVALGMATFYGVSYGTSRNIPELLLGLEDPIVFRLANLEVLEEKQLKNGAMCIRLRGQDFNGTRVTIWINKVDFLIRKIEEVSAPGSRETTTYDPEINLEISPEELRFHRPSAP